MRPWRLLPLAGLLSACPVQTSVVSVPVEAESPAVALDATALDSSYGATAGSCFQVPGTSRGTGFASNPDLALGTVWTHPADCDAWAEDDCTWEPTLSIYQGPDRVENTTEEEVFSGFARFDESGSSRAMAQLFGIPVVAGAVAELSAVRTWEGHVDYRSENVQSWVGSWVMEEDITPGFAWQVTVFEWTARFLTELNFDDELGENETAYDIEGTVYRRTNKEQRGYEVYACVTPM